MLNAIRRYTHWLHTKWPAGTVEKLPAIGADGQTNLPAVRVVGDLSGIPLLKFASETAARAVHAILAEGNFERGRNQFDLVIVGAGVGGISAAIEAKKAGLRFVVFEATERFSTVVNFPKAKPIYTYPTEMTPSGGLQFKADVKEALLAEMEQQREEAGIETRQGRVERLEANPDHVLVYLAKDAHATHSMGKDARATHSMGKDAHGTHSMGKDAHATHSMGKDARATHSMGKDAHATHSMGKDARATHSMGKDAHATHSMGKDARATHSMGKDAHATTIRATRVIVAIGRSGNFRKLGCPGEDLEKVFNRLHDPKDFAGQDALVVGGGDTALETAIALATCGARVTLSYRRKEFARPKPENVEKLRMLVANPAAEVAIERPSSERITTAASSEMRGNNPPGSIRLLMGSQIARIEEGRVTIIAEGGQEQVIENDVVFSMIGREAPLDFFRRSGIRITGEWTPVGYLSFAIFFVCCCFIYLWKGGTDLKKLFEANHWFPFNVPGWFDAAGGAISAWANTPAHLLGTLKISLADPGFYYSLAYSTVIVIFGFRRIWRRKTPYVGAQTATLMAVQVLPLFLLPYILLPWAGHNGWFDAGFGKLVADNLFPAANYAHGREYWRAFGLILAWPLFIWNLFTEQPLWWWLVISLTQTFVIIPWLVVRWGKGAYCGWICSCGALAETLGDRQRQKMPHGPFWNRVNMVGQVILWVALFLFLLRFVSWIAPGLGLQGIYHGLLSSWQIAGIQLNYYQVVDIFLAGVVGVACYFWFSGRVWCRFACPLAALMHIYARFTQFHIFAEKKKCISCNVCTSVCHQGIDIMNFANKGMPMADPECVRCSACVQMCPTGVLSFGRYNAKGKVVLDRLPASPVQIRESARSRGF
jgi:thioredoxin reductase/ferredoxin